MGQEKNKNQGYYVGTSTTRKKPNFHKCFIDAVNSKYNNNWVQCFCNTDILEEDSSLFVKGWHFTY